MNELLLAFADDGRPALAAAPGWPASVIPAWQAMPPEGISAVGLKSGQIAPVARKRWLDIVAESRGCGIVLLDADEGWRAATRVEEANHDRPTALVSVTRAGGFPLAGDVDVIRWIGGPTRQPARDFLPWERWDVLDPAWAEATQGAPFVGWSDGQPLWVLSGGPGSEAWFGHEPLLGPWASSDGTLFLSSDPGRLASIFDRYEGPVRRVFSTGSDPEAPLQIEPIDDLLAWLDEREHRFPEAVTLVINPLGPRGWAAVLPPYSRRLLTTTGEYALEEGNVLRAAGEMGGWTGFSTLHYGGGPDFQLLPLGRTFAGDVWGDLGSDLQVRTEQELAEFLTHVVTEHEAAPVHSVEEDDLAACFSLLFWEQEFGERVVLTFPNLIEVLAFLGAQERHVDRPRRASGLWAQDGWQIDSGGSGDVVGEDHLGERIRAALVRWGSQFAQRGYQPADGDALTRVVNATFQSIHVELAGFLGDLLWRLNSDDEQLASVVDLDSFPADPDMVQRWLGDATLRPDPRFADEARRRLGAAAWDLLDPRSRFFLATALADFAARGESPVSDYAPVNLSLIKALEVELGRILEGFRVSRTEWPAAGQGRNDQILTRYLAASNAPAPTIGEIRHLFSAPTGPLHQALRDYLETTPHQAVTTSRFRERLAKVISVYRNGGVHDKPIPLDNCRACFADLLDGAARAGLVAIAAGVGASRAE